MDLKNVDGKLIKINNFTNMEGCLLCLEISKELENFIKVDSLQWLELNVQSIIEKHFWRIEMLNGYNSLCATCWQELHDFHEFYKRIEVAHINIGKLMKIEVETPADDNFIKELSPQESKDLFDINLSNTRHLEPEVLLIKEENPLEGMAIEEDDDGDDDDEDDDKPLKPRQRKGQCLAENEPQQRSFKKKDDPLKKLTKKSKNCKSKTKKSSKKLKKSLDKPFCSINSETNQEKDKEFSIKNETEVLKLEKDENTNTNSDYNEETDYEDDDEEANSQSNPRKPKKLGVNTKLSYEKNEKFISEHIQLYCHLCQMQLESFTSLLKHFHVEHQERGYAMCCQRKFLHRTDLVDHIYTHKNPEHFKCNICGKVFADRHCLRVHIKNLHEGNRNTQAMFDCDICGKMLSNRHALQIHKYTMHEVTQDDRETCTECNRTFRNKLSLTSHIKSVHLKKYAKICDLCGITISDKRIFVRHMLQHEGKPLPTVACSICGRIYTERKSLHRHMNLAHPKEKVEYSCELCPKKFASQDNVKKHVKNVHEASYVQKCTVCEKIFRRPDALRDHMSRHTGTPLHSCPWCPKAFYSNGQMHAHRKETHPKEWEQFIREKHSGNLPEKYKLPAALQINSF